MCGFPPRSVSKTHLRARRTRGTGTTLENNNTNNSVQQTTLLRCEQKCNCICLLASMDIIGKEAFGI